VADDDLVAALTDAMPAVVVLVGPSGSGKTTLRHRLVAEGLSPDAVVSLDDLRREVRAEAERRGLRPRPLQEYSAAAVRRARRRADVLAAFGTGYVADATHLRRRDRREHVGVAQDTGLPVIAVLTAFADLAELLRRNAARPDDERVPDEVVARQHHRRSLLSQELLGEEGFAKVCKWTGGPAPA
jgi:predicted kinase